MGRKKGGIPVNITKWTDSMVCFLKENASTMTNKELAANLNLTLTVTRNKKRELGLNKMVLEYWTKEMVDFLKASYRELGDVEITKFFITHYPKCKGWKRGAIWKKRKQLNLIRTYDERKKLMKKNSGPGGSAHTITKNSSSLNMHPSWVVQRIAWRDKERQEELLKHPEIIEAAKAIILINRKIRHHENKTYRPEHTPL